MRLLDLTLPTPAENIALDEALLDAAEAGELDHEVLRFWESPQPLAVVGRSSRVAEEIDIAVCNRLNVPILRRASGGAAIVAGPGCLMYAVVLGYESREHLRLLDEAHRHVLSRLADAIRPWAAGIEPRGTSDLAVVGRKVSGNSARCKRSHFLYHGTLLYKFDLRLIPRLLRMPPRQPDYRGGRPHADFVANLPANGEALTSALTAAFGATAPLADWPQTLTQQLVTERYSQATWNFQR